MKKNPVGLHSAPSTNPAMAILVEKDRSLDYHESVQKELHFYRTLMASLAIFCGWVEPSKPKMDDVVKAFRDHLIGTSPESMERYRDKMAWLTGQPGSHNPDARPGQESSEAKPRFRARFDL